MIIFSVLYYLYYYLYFSNNLKRVQNETKFEVSNVDDTFYMYGEAFIISRLFDGYLLCITMPLSFIVASPTRRRAIRQYFSKMYEIIILKNS